jgi:hypothetical protein
MAEHYETTGERLQKTCVEVNKEDRTQESKSYAEAEVFTSSAGTRNVRFRDH